MQRPGVIRSIYVTHDPKISAFICVHLRLLSSALSAATPTLNWQLETDTLPHWSTYAFTSIVLETRVTGSRCRRSSSNRGVCGAGKHVADSDRVASVDAQSRQADHGR
jgi:hypothetical protein